MIKDYKGDMPKNVTTPDKAKAQKPFYKNWKFWVLTGLMTLFGACSIYGLVLGSQYVKAIERASHIIADAKGSGEESNKPLPKNIGGRHDSIAFEWWPSATGYYGLNGETMEWGASLPFFNIQFDNTLQKYTLRLTWAGYYEMSLLDYVSDYTFETYNHQGFTIDQNYSNGIGRLVFDYVGLPMHFKGVFHFDPYQSGYTQGQSDGYSDGYTEGYADGENDGYQEGYSDGSDAINVNQYFRVVMPIGNDSVQYESFLDGVADAQGTIVGGTTSPNYREFTRNRNQVLRVDLTLPANYRAFWSYTPAFTSSFPVSDNISLQQSWAVDGVVYLPTWEANVQIWVGVTSAQVPDLTSQTISVAFDVAHWGDIKVGAYQQGYQQGYVDGQQDPTAYQSGYDAGYSDGHDAGEVEGFNRGVGVGSSGSSSLAHMFRVAFQLPFDQLYAYLNFNLLGINFASLFSALITVSLGIIVIKKVL